MTTRTPLSEILSAISVQNAREKKSREQREPSGSIITYYSAWPKQLHYVLSLFDTRMPDWNHPQWRLFAHVLVTGRGAFVPVWYKLMQQALEVRNPHNVWSPLSDAGLIERKPHNRFKKLSAEYRVPQEIAATFEKLEREGIDTALEGRYNLVSRTETIAPVHRTTLTKNGHRYPDIIRAAMEQITFGLFNPAAIEAYLEEEGAQVERAHERWIQNGAIEDESVESYRRKRKLEMRHANNWRCYQAILRQKPEPAPNYLAPNYPAPDYPAGIYRYEMAYEPQSTGRLTQKSGGLQSCSRKMKERAYSGIAGIGGDRLRNYDLKSSHAQLLVGFFEEANIHCPWLDEYVSNPSVAKRIADHLRITKGVWKRMFYTLPNGGMLPPNVSKHTRRLDIRKLIDRHVPEPDRAETLRELRRVVEPFTAALDQWHDYLVGDYVDANYGVGSKGKYIKNDVGMPFYPEEHDNSRRRGRMAAHLLQGREALYIHTLTTLAPKYGFEVISNEHDGLVTIGDISEAAQAQARRESGVRRTVLVEKPFC